MLSKKNHQEVTKEKEESKKRNRDIRWPYATQSNNNLLWEARK